MLLKQKGEKKKRQVGINANGSPEYFNFGWNDAEFYWPVVMTQLNIDRALFAANQKSKEETAVIDTSYITDGINAEEILKLTFKGDLVERFGKEGTEFLPNDDNNIESRGIRDTTEAKFLVKDLDDNLSINPNINIENNKWAGVYTYNNGNFPFILKDYRYLFLTEGALDNPNIMLLELYPQNSWFVSAHQNFDDEGYLIDFADSNKTLISATDTVTDLNGNESDLDGDSICQWIVSYRVKKVLKYHKAK